MAEVDTRALKHDHSFIIMPTSNPPCFPKANMIEGRLHVSYFASTCSINMAMFLSDREWLYHLYKALLFFFCRSVCRRVGILEPVDGGVDRACRGSSAGDNNPILGLHNMHVYWIVLSCAFIDFCNWYCTVQFWDMFLLGLWRVRSSDDACDVVIGMGRYAMQSRLLFYFHMCKTRAEELLWDRRPTGFWRLPKRMLAQSRMQAHFQRV